MEKLFPSLLQFKRSSVIIHILTWLCILLFPVSIFNINLHGMGTIHVEGGPRGPGAGWNFLYKMVLTLLAYAAFFYLHLLYLLPRFLKNRRLSHYLMALVFCLLALFGLEMIFEYYLLFKNSPPIISVVHDVMEPNLTAVPFTRPAPPLVASPPSFFSFAFPLVITRVLFNAALVFSVSGALKFTSEWIKNENQKRAMENEKLVTELSFLKSQVNPHFLFNTLNNIYSLANRKSDLAPAAIIKLSGLMRYMLYESNDHLVSLAREVEYLRDYIDLQRLRFPEETPIEFTVEGQLEDRMIEPMLLIPLVENAFKHGGTHPETPRIGIALRVEAEEIQFRVENTYLPQNGSAPKEKSGIGLRNISRRLNLLYPDRHRLTIYRQKEHFCVEMCLDQ